jgi:hypothetical protein
VQKQLIAFFRNNVTVPDLLGKGLRTVLTHTASISWP